jgi:hypothetical protein
MNLLDRHNVVICTGAIMADKPLREKLEALHEDLVDDISLKVREGMATADDKKLAVQLLRNSNISAPVVDDAASAAAASKLAGKLDFSGLSDRRKVVPLRPTDDAA